MSEPLPVFVLDSFALLAYFRAEPGGELVRGLLRQARNQAAHLCMSLINVGEVYYLMRKERDIDRAEEMLGGVRTMPISLVSVSEERIFAAARLKGEYPISYADAFAAGLAGELGATLVTGDPEFKALETRIRILWLPQK